MPTETPKHRSPEAPPSWDNARLYLSTVRETGRRFITAQICLGWELENLKQRLGFVRGNNQYARIGHDDRSTWKEWVEAELDVSRETADRFIRTFEGFRAKLTKKLAAKVFSLGEGAKPIGRSQAEHLVHAIAAPPSALTEKERKTVEKAIALASDGSTQSALLAELKLVKATKIEKGDGGGGDDGPEDEEPDESAQAEQLAFAFFHPATEIGSLRASGDFERRLNSLPLVTEDPDKPCLTRMRDDLAGLLSEVEAAIESKTSNR